MVILVHRKPPYKLVNIPAPFIRVITGCYWNHVACVAECLGELFVFEAAEKGFIPVMKVSDYMKQVGVNIEIAIVQPDENKYPVHQFYSNLSEILSHGYDFTSLLWWQVWYQLTGKWSGKKNFEAKSRVYCSEAIAYGYKDIFNEPWTVSPRDIWMHHDMNLIWESARNSRINWELKNKVKWVR